MDHNIQVWGTHLLNIGTGIEVSCARILTYIVKCWKWPFLPAQSLNKNMFKSSALDSNKTWAGRNCANLNNPVLLSGLSFIGFTNCHEHVFLLEFFLIWSLTLCVLPCQTNCIIPIEFFDPFLILCLILFLPDISEQFFSLSALKR